jgi:hypothetical protein
VITLATNNKDPLMYNVFEIIDGEDANKFTLKGDELTFKATVAFVQISQRSTLRLEMGMTLLSPLALSTRLIKLLV